MLPILRILKWVYELGRKNERTKIELRMRQYLAARPVPSDFTKLDDDNIRMVNETEYRYRLDIYNNTRTIIDELLRPTPTNHKRPIDEE